jgi:hypothetical protein
LNPGEDIIQINTSELASGFYLLEIGSGNGNSKSIRKFIK